MSHGCARVNPAIFPATAVRSRSPLAWRAVSYSIQMALALIPAACDALAAAGCLYLLVAAIAVLRFGRRADAPPRPNAHAAVSILRPLHGFEPHLERRLERCLRQNYAGAVQLICGVRHRGDGAIAAVENLATRHPERNIALIVNTREHGANRKVTNLGNMLPHAAHDLLVIADSDIDVGPDYLAHIVAHLQRPGTDAVTYLYHGVAGPGAWSRMAALAINAHFLPNVVIAIGLDLAKPCFGATIALRRDTLARIGGFSAFADCLADDHAIGQALRSAGYTIAIPGTTVGHVCFHESLRSLLASELRAARTIRNINPIGFFGTLVAHPFPLALIGALAGGGNALLLATIAIGCRLVLCLCIEQAFRLTRQPLWLIPLRDVLSFAVYVWSYFGTTVTWRNLTYRIAPGGRLVPGDGAKPSNIAGFYSNVSSLLVEAIGRYGGRFRPGRRG
jgi:ceramide glucosyltransferase